MAAPPELRYRYTKYTRHLAPGAWHVVMSCHVMSAVTRYTRGRATRPLFWQLPYQFLGNKITAYGGNMTTVQTFTSSDPAPRPLADSDVIMIGNDLGRYSMMVVSNIPTGCSSALHVRGGAGGRCAGAAPRAPVRGRLVHPAGQRPAPGLQVGCDWWRAGHVTTVLTSDWSTGRTSSACWPTSRRSWCGRAWRTTWTRPPSPGSTWT